MAYMPSAPSSQRQTRAKSGGSGFDTFMHYLENYKGEAVGSSVIIPANKTILLPDIECRFVVLANWNVENDDPAAYSFYAPSAQNIYENSGEEIYYGFGGIVVAQLFPSQSSGLLPVNNASQICISARPNASKTVWFAYFR